MKNVEKGEIYNFDGILHLVLEEVEKLNDSEIVFQTNEDIQNKPFYCSVDFSGDMNTLLQVENYGILYPTEKWDYVGKLSDPEFAEVLERFHAHIAKKTEKVKAVRIDHHIKNNL